MIEFYSCANCEKEYLLKIFIGTTIHEIDLSGNSKKGDYY
jgi:hypothetical protein